MFPGQTLSLFDPFAFDVGHLVCADRKRRIGNQCGDREVANHTTNSWTLFGSIQNRNI